MYDMVTTVANITLYNWNSLRENLSVLTKKKSEVMDTFMNSVAGGGVESSHNIHRCQIFTWYTSSYNFICQLYLNKLGKIFRSLFIPLFENINLDYSEVGHWFLWSGNKQLYMQVIRKRATPLFQILSKINHPLIFFFFSRKRDGLEISLT